jgi:hypothetical protein
MPPVQEIRQRGTDAEDDERRGAYPDAAARPRGPARQGEGVVPDALAEAALESAAVLRMEPARFDLVADLVAPTEPERDDEHTDVAAWHWRWREALRRRAPIELVEAVAWTGLRLTRPEVECGGGLRWTGLLERGATEAWETTLGWRDGVAAQPGEWRAHDARGVVARVRRGEDGGLMIDLRPGTVAEVCVGLVPAAAMGGGGRTLAWRPESGEGPTEWRGTHEKSPWGWGPTASWRVEATPRTGVTLVLQAGGTPWGWRRRVNAVPIPDP